MQKQKNLKSCNSKRGEHEHQSPEESGVASASSFASNGRKDSCAVTGKRTVGKRYPIETCPFGWNYKKSCSAQQQNRPSPRVNRSPKLDIRIISAQEPLKLAVEDRSLHVSLHNVTHGTLSTRETHIHLADKEQVRYNRGYTERKAEIITSFKQSIVVEFDNAHQPRNSGCNLARKMF